MDGCQCDYCNRAMYTVTGCRCAAAASRLGDTRLPGDRGTAASCDHGYTCNAGDTAARSRHIDTRSTRSDHRATGNRNASTYRCSTDFHAYINAHANGCTDGLIID